MRARARDESSAAVGSGCVHRSLQYLGSGRGLAIPAKPGQAVISPWAKIAATLYVLATFALIVLGAFSKIPEVIAAAVTIALGIVLLVVWSAIRKG